MEREERIFVTYMPVPLRGNKGPNVGYHASLNYVDKHGNHYIVEAEPAGYDDLPTIADKAGAFLDEELFSSGARNRDSRFGRLVARERSAKPGDLSRPFEYDDLSREWDAIRATVRMVNERGYEYRPYSQNSNTFVFAALKAARLDASGNAYDPVRK